MGALTLMQLLSLCYPNEFFVHICNVVDIRRCGDLEEAEYSQICCRELKMKGDIQPLMPIATFIFVREMYISLIKCSAHSSGGVFLVWLQMR
uniref:FZ domain-containing protein n=1 Tax=Ascaris lumbricoides TaxID=6252 RepID=A0A0M3HIY9_ASCLU